MNFLTNLAKGFVRSAVNQVGKDTGKIVSNKYIKMRILLQLEELQAKTIFSMKRMKALLYQKKNLCLINK